MQGERIQLAFWAIEIPFTRSLRTARGESKNQQTVIVEVLDRDSRLAGYGEIGCIRRAGLDADRVGRELTRARPLIESYAGENPDDFWARWDPTLGSCRAVQAGVDTAIHDLWARVRGLPLWKAWGLEAGSVPSSCRTVSLGSVEEMADEVVEVAAWSALKLKIARSTTMTQIERLRELTSAPFRFDGNGGLDAAWVRANASAMVDAGGELLEQPLSEDDVAGHRALHETIGLPVYADESCHDLRDVHACAGAFAGVNVKLAKCGGLTPARQMMTAAGRLGLSTMVGCMGETSVGISAAAQLLPLADLADLDSACLMAGDVASGVRVCPEGICLPDGDGIGAEIDWGRMAQYRSQEGAPR